MTTFECLRASRIDKDDILECRRASPSLITSRFWPRVRARALRAHPSFWAHAVPNGALRAPSPPIAASLLFIHASKIKIIHRTRAAPVKGFFISIYQSPRPESIQSATTSIQSSELGPPPPYLQESVAPPLWIQGGRHAHFRRKGWGGGPIPTMGHTLWYSG